MADDDDDKNDDNRFDGLSSSSSMLLNPDVDEAEAESLRDFEPVEPTRLSSNRLSNGFSSFSFESSSLLLMLLLLLLLLSAATSLLSRPL